MAVTTRAAAVTVIAPAGTFQRAFDTADPLAEWAAAAAALPRPGASPAGPRGPAGLAADGAYPSPRLAAPADTARRFDLTELRLTRTGDRGGAPGYVLGGSNGAWPFALRVTPAQGAALLAALRGEHGPGAVA